MLAMLVFLCIMMCTFYTFEVHIISLYTATYLMVTWLYINKSNSLAFFNLKFIKIIVLVQVIIHVYNLSYDLNIIAYIVSTILYFMIVMSEYLENIRGLNDNSSCNILKTINDNNINQYIVNHMTIRHSPSLDDEAFKSFIKK